jgi:hypothetical protein
LTEQERTVPAAPTETETTTGSGLSAPAEGQRAKGRAAHLLGQAQKGGRAVVEKYGREHMRELGRRGARAVTDRYGLRFYSEIAARNKGVPKRKTG